MAIPRLNLVQTRTITRGFCQRSELHKNFWEIEDPEENFKDIIPG